VARLFAVSSSERPQDSRRSNRYASRSYQLRATRRVPTNLAVQSDRPTF